MEQMWIGINLLADFIEIFCVFKIMEINFGSKYKSYINWIAIILLAFVELILNDFEVNSLIVFSIVFIVVLFLYKSNWVYKLLAFFSFIVIISLIDLLLALVLTKTMNITIPILLDSNIYRLLYIILSKLILYTILIVYMKKKTYRTFKMNHWALIQVILLVINVVAIIIFMKPLLEVSNEILVEIEISINYLLISLITLCFLSVTIYYGLIKLSNEQMELKLLDQQKNLQFGYVKDVDLALSEMKSVRHDMANHISCIKGLVTYGEYDKLEDYIDKLTDPIESGDEIVLTDHPAISSFIYSKARRAKQLGIQFDLNTNIQANVNIEDIDLSVLFGNVLDNAIEACQRIKNGERTIELTIEQQMGCFVIHCVNTMNEIIIDKKTNTFISNKTSKNRHGIGLKNIEAIVRKYDGEINFKTENRIFDIRIVLFEK